MMLRVFEEEIYHQQARERETNAWHEEDRNEVSVGRKVSRKSPCDLPVIQTGDPGLQRSIGLPDRSK